MASIFDIFDNSVAKKAAQDQIAGINSGLTSATGAINTGSQDLTTNYTAALQPYLQNYQQAGQGTQALMTALGLGGPGGAAGAQQIQQQLQNSPGYQFQLNQGNQNVLRNSAQTGTTASGATLDALQTQGQGKADQTYQQYVQNLQPFLGASNAAAGGISSGYQGLGQGLNANQNNLANLNWGAATGIGNANANADLAQNQANKNIWGALGAISPLAASVGGSGSGGGGASAMMQILPMMMSDERLKEDISKVGELYDHQPVYSYRYIWDDPAMTRIGLMAQDVEKINPDAVREVGGFKAVDYGKATGYASELARFLEAA